VARILFCSETIPPSLSLLNGRQYTLPAHVSSMSDPVYDILIEDADGRHLRLERLRDLEIAKQRLPVLAAQYPGTRLILWNQKTRAILAATDGY
jgi:hypothetical protein